MPARVTGPRPGQRTGLIRSLATEVVLGVPRYSTAASVRAEDNNVHWAKGGRMSMLADEVDVVIGIDTHKYTHTAAVLSASTAGVLAKMTVASATAGYEELYRLGQRYGERRAWSIEGTASYGAGLTEFLQARAERVIEMDHPNRAKRRNGVKNDEVDAVRAAREALARDKLAEPRCQGQRACLATLLCVRASAVEAAKQARTQFQSLVVTSPEPLRERLGKPKGLALLRAGADLADQDGDSPELRLMAGALRALARRALSLYQEAKSYQASMRTIVEEWHPELLAQSGVGTIVAATVLCAWSHPGRFRSEASFAMLAGSAPLDASSGLSTHHRLSRCGDRQLNRALHVVVITRWTKDKATIAYCQKRRADGKSDREIKRCLKRYVARSLFRLLESSSTGTETMT